jgi:uncharacterized protein YlxW (UPF0749 family)
MDENLAILLVLAMSIAGAVALVVATRWMRLHGADRPNDANPSGAAITAERDQLRAQVRDLTVRLAAVESSVTTENRSLAREIEQLR